MKIKRLYINNYKSLVDFELLEPNPFSVFVGPNAAGKSNVFEALEFLSYWILYGRRVSPYDPFGASPIFGGASSYLHKSNFPYSAKYKTIDIEIDINGIPVLRQVEIRVDKKENFKETSSSGSAIEASSQKESEFLEMEIPNKENEYVERFSRIFINKGIEKRIPQDGKLSVDAKDLEPVLHRILQDEAKRDEITEWIEYLIPGLEKVEVAKSDLSGDFYLRIFEKHLPDPIGKNLISDGTYNILALLTAVYQSDEPQFLCIEEPENGITPYVQRALVNFFRTTCEEKGHYIWLNTHSPTIVNELAPKELILIDKVEGITKAKQLDPNLDFKTMKLDEAWLTNTLGGGLPW